MNKNYALINLEGIVVNVFVWDGESEWLPPIGHTILQSDEARIGSVYDPQTGTFKDKPKKE